MRRLFRWIGVLAVVLLFATAAGAALPHFAIDLLPPHTAKRSSAVLEEPLRKALDASLAEAKIATAEDARDFALSATDKLLHFGLGHPTSLTFGTTDREAHCVEYSHLYARIFDRAAAKGGIPAKAYVVHSAKAQLFGHPVPMRGWEDHDWVLIQDGSGDEARRFYVDPTLHDAGLGWDISSNVRGNVKLP